MHYEGNAYDACIPADKTYGVSLMCQLMKYSNRFEEDNG